MVMKAFRFCEKCFIIGCATFNISRRIVLYRVGSLGFTLFEGGGVIVACVT